MRGPSRRVASRRRGPPRCIGVRVGASSSAPHVVPGNLIGAGACHLCAAAGPAVARRLSIRAVTPPRLPRPGLAPHRPRTGSRHAAIVYPRRLNAFVSPDAKTTHSFRARPRPADPRCPPAPSAPSPASHRHSHGTAPTSDPCVTFTARGRRNDARDVARKPRARPHAPPLHGCNLYERTGLSLSRKKHSVINQQYCKTT
ncbi:unnamed protein product, partial [Iphiclides podalirius]